MRCRALRLCETGLRNHELDRIVMKKPICGSMNRFVSVGLTECYGAFFTLFYGLLLALAFFVVEICTKV